MSENFVLFELITEQIRTHRVLNCFLVTTFFSDSSSAGDHLFQQMVWKLHCSSRQHTFFIGLHPVSRIEVLHLYIFRTLYKVVTVPLIKKANLSLIAFRLNAMEDRLNSGNVFLQKLAPVLSLYYCQKLLFWGITR